MLDADGATDYKEIVNIYDAVRDLSVKDGKGLVCTVGTRNQGGQVQRKGIRKLLNSCNQIIVRHVIGFNCTDT